MSKFYGITLMNISIINDQKGEHKKALAQLEQVKEIFLKTIGKDTLNYANLLFNMGRVYSKLG